MIPKPPGNTEQLLDLCVSQSCLDDAANLRKADSEGRCYTDNYRRAEWYENKAKLHTELLEEQKCRFREYWRWTFAGQIMAAWCASPEGTEGAKLAIDLADALIAELERGGK
jgi:hypothetical protein